MAQVVKHQQVLIPYGSTAPAFVRLNGSSGDNSTTSSSRGVDDLVANIMETTTTTTTTTENDNDETPLLRTTTALATAATSETTTSTILVTDSSSGNTTNNNSNISHAADEIGEAIPPIPDDIDDGDDDDEETRCSRTAMEYSQEASLLLQQQQLEESLEAYKKAADCYCVLKAKPSSSPHQNQQSQNLVAAVNAAGCFRNMGAVNRLLCNYGDAIHHLHCAEELYHSSRQRVLQKQQAMAVTGIDGTTNNNNNNNSSGSSDSYDAKEGHPAEEQGQQGRRRRRSRTATNTTGEDENENHSNGETLCLDFLILETMQSRATFYFQHLKDVDKAISCHEECLRLLLDIHQEEEKQRTIRTTTTAGNGDNDKNLHQKQQQQEAAIIAVEEGVAFTKLSKHQFLELLTVSLENLVGMYRTTTTTTISRSGVFPQPPPPPSDDDDDDDGHDEDEQQKRPGENLRTVEEAVKVLQDELHVVLALSEAEEEVKYLTASSSSGDHDDDADVIRKPLTRILRNLSEVYYERHQMDRAVDALHDAMDIELKASEEPSTEVLDAMDQMGLANEQMEFYDKAISCYEKALLARSRFLGEEHIDVAKSLINVARILELQNNTEGSLDLYKAAHAIYALQITSIEFECAGEDAAAILDMIPTMLEHRRFEEARAYLTKCLSIAENEDNKINDESLDKSQIYYDLGQAYMGLRDYVSATICLVEAAKEEHGRVSEQDVYAMLRKVEILQRKEQLSRPHKERTLTIRGASSGVVSLLSMPSTATSTSLTTATMLGGAEFPLRRTLTSEYESFPYHHHHQSGSQITDDSFHHHQSRHARHSTYPSLLTPTLSTAHSADFAVGEPLKPRFFATSPTMKSHPSEISSILLSDEDVGHHPGDGPSITIDPVPLEDVEPTNNRNNDFFALGAPLLSDEGPEEPSSPFSSDSNNGRRHRRRRSLLRGGGGGGGGSGNGSGSPRRSKDEKSVQSQQRSITQVLGAKLRRRRQGFQTLKEEQLQGEAANDDVPDSTELPTEEDATDDEEDSLLFPGPVAYLDLPATQSCDDLSDITLRMDDPDASRDTSQEWWWGVTAEGFGRWFPASYVSQAVQAADAFLSAKAIHSKSNKVNKEPAASRALEVVSEDEESAEESGSQEQQEYASNVGITSTKASRGPYVDTSGTGIDMNHKVPPRPHHQSVFSSNGPHHLTDGKDIRVEIANCRELLIKEQKEFGKEHPKVATSLFRLAILYSRDQDTEASVECATESLRIQQQNGDKGDAARSLHFLADLNLHQKQYKQAVTHYGKALSIETDHFGYFSEEAARTLNCIGTVKMLQNEFREAMENHEEALRILKECHGEDLKNPLVSETLCQIGSVYYRERNALGTSTSSPDGYSTFIEGGMLEVIGRAHEDRGSYKMAIAFFEEKLQWLESKGKSREILEDAATTLNGLGMLSLRAGLLSEAIDYYEKALSIQLQLGCDEVHLATARVLTGAVQAQLGDWREALQLLEKALICLQDELGDKHETVAATHFQIGIVQAALCEHDVAMDAFNEALDIQNDLLGDDHPATLRTRREIGNLYAMYEADTDSAFEHFNFVLEKQKQIHGDRHPNVAETLHSIGRAYARQGNHADALRHLEECYYMRVEFLGWDHLLQATTLHDIAKIHLKRGRIKKALHICNVVLGIRRETLTERHVDVARTLTTKGSCLVAQGDTEKGYACLMEALAMLQENVGENHPSVADVYAELGALHLRKCQFDQARNAIQKALDIYCWSNLDDDYHGIQNCKAMLQRVERDEMLCV